MKKCPQQSQSEEADNADVTSHRIPIEDMLQMSPKSGSGKKRTIRTKIVEENSPSKNGSKHEKKIASGGVFIQSSLEIGRSLEQLPRKRNIETAICCLMVPHFLESQETVCAAVYKSPTGVAPEDWRHTREQLHLKLEAVGLPALIFSDNVGDLWKMGACRLNDPTKHTFERINCRTTPDAFWYWEPCSMGPVPIPPSFISCAEEYPARRLHHNMQSDHHKLLLTHKYEDYQDKRDPRWWKKTRNDSNWEEINERLCDLLDENRVLNKAWKKKNSDKFARTLLSDINSILEEEVKWVHPTKTKLADIERQCRESEKEIVKPSLSAEERRAKEKKGTPRRAIGDR